MPEWSLAPRPRRCGCPSSATVAATVNTAVHENVPIVSGRVRAEPIRSRESVSGGRMRQAHVVILTAITLEYQEALKVDAGAWEGSRWEEEKGPNGLPVAFRTFRGKGGRRLRVVVGLAGGMAGVAAANALIPLVETYRP